MHKQQKGFTLIEVLVVVGILAILLAITLIALNPARHFADTRNTQRSSDVSAILNAVYQYQASNNGNLPAALAGLDTSAHDLAKSSPVVASEVDLCSALVPAYIADLPMDPDTSHTSKTPSNGSVCSVTTTAYNTGYRIAKSASNRFTVTAPWAESATIAVTR